MTSTPDARDDRTADRAVEADDTEGHIRTYPRLAGDQPARAQQATETDTEGHSRFGLFLDADNPTGERIPQRQGEPQREDGEGHLA